MKQSEDRNAQLIDVLTSRVDRLTTQQVRLAEATRDSLEDAARAIDSLTAAVSMLAHRLEDR